MLQTADALNGVVETPRENHESIGMGTRGINPAVETLGDLTLFRLVVRSEGNTGLNARNNILGEPHQQKENVDKGKCSLDGGLLNDKTVKVDGSVPDPVHRVPREVVGTNRISEASVGVLVIGEHVVADLAIEGSVRQIRPSNDRLMRNVGRSGISQSKLVAVHDLFPISETVVSDEEPLLPTGTVFVNVERIDADLGLVEGRRVHVVGKRGGEVARTVVVHRGLGERRCCLG